MKIKSVFQYFTLFSLLMAFGLHQPAIAAAPYYSVSASVGGAPAVAEGRTYPHGEVVQVVSGTTFTLDAAAHSTDDNGNAIVDFFWFDMTSQMLPSGEGVFPMRDTQASSQTFIAPTVVAAQTYPHTPYAVNLQVKNSDNTWSRGHIIYIEVLPEQPSNNLTISQHDNYLLYSVSQKTFDAWSTDRISDTQGIQNVQTLTQAVYQQFQDEFDFIWVYLDRDTRPDGMPYGQYLSVSNDVDGLGDRVIFDDTADYGSQGQLKGVSVLYASMNDNNSVLKAMHLDATLHELFHQYGNFIVPPYTSHWEYGIDGVLNGAGSRMNAIEQYLAGYISTPDGLHADAWDADSLAIWDTWQKDARFTPRYPDYQSAPKHLRGLVVVVSPRQTLTESLDNKLSANIDNFTRTDGEHKRYNNGEVESQNFWQATGGEGIGGTFSLNNLSRSLK